MADHALRTDIRRLVDGTIPPAPWLNDRVLAAVAADIRVGRSQARTGLRRAIALAWIAAILIAAASVGALINARLAATHNPTPANQPVPSREPALAAYRQMLEVDLTNIIASERGVGCATRNQCLAVVVRNRDETQKLLNDLDSHPAPASVSDAAVHLRTAAQAYSEELSASALAIQVPGSDFISLAYGPDIDSVDRAVATIVCWPVNPYQRNDLAEGYGCTPQPVNIGLRG